MAASPPADSKSKWQRFEWIADSTSSPERVLDLVRACAGQPQRRPGLETPCVEPQTTTEAVLAEIWADVLSLEPIGTHDDFFQLGGTSLLAVDLFAQIARRLGRKLPLTSLIEAPTVERLARLIAGTACRDSLVLIRDGRGKPPVFLVHDGDGETMLYRNLALLLKPDHAVYGLQPHSRDNVPIAHSRISDMAANYIDRIRSVQPQGPYLVGGMCAGGVIAFEIACQLQRQGAKAAMVALIDAADVVAVVKPWRLANRRIRSFQTAFHQNENEPVRWNRVLLTGLARASRKAKNLSIYLIRQRLKELLDGIRMRLFRYCLDCGLRLPRSLEQIPVRTAYLFAEKDYQPESPFDGDLVLFRATHGEGADEPYIDRYDDPLLGWGPRATGKVRAFDVPGGHSSMLQEPHVRNLADQMQSAIDEALADELIPPDRRNAAIPSRRAPSALRTFC
jgi:thioesterase domain-containing protein